MRESGYYAPGTEFDPRAPWNEKAPKSTFFDVVISQTLSKSTRVETSDYVEAVDQDEDGKFSYKDTSETDWREAYSQHHYTPLELIEKFKEFLNKHLPDPIIDMRRYKEFKELIKECEGWEEDETEIIEE